VAYFWATLYEGLNELHDSRPNLVHVMHRFYSVLIQSQQR